jgi:hypothetical protein
MAWILFGDIEGLDYMILRLRDFIIVTFAFALGYADTQSPPSSTFHVTSLRIFLAQGHIYLIIRISNLWFSHHGLERAFS